ncbi:SRPBCC family protein [Haladaptatus sp.]|uniref:SRPBCC family protein n=1 Tax=Haladaptatus sp. TaxID=1973141 RepID=UPI003C52FAC8
MAIYQREVWVDAPFEDVWRFYSTTDGLEALTPGWMNLRVEGVRGPDGEADPDVLEAGTQIRMSLRPFGVGPRQRWTSTIVEREEENYAAMFRDEMSDGPFPEWEHTHQFYAGDLQQTLVRDKVEYRFPALGEAGNPLAKVGFEPMFLYRHAKTKHLLER